MTPSLIARVHDITDDLARRLELLAPSCDDAADSGDVVAPATVLSLAIARLQARAQAPPATVAPRTPAEARDGFVVRKRRT